MNNHDPGALPTPPTAPRMPPEAPAASATTAAPAPATAAPSPGRARWWRRGAAAFAIVVLASIGALGGAAWWALHGAAGTAWLLTRIPGVAVSAPRGALLGDFDAATLVWRLPGTGTLRIDGLAWRGLRFGRAAASPWLRLRIDRLEAARVDWRSEAGPTPSAGGPPESLKTPLQIDVAQLRIGELRIGGDATTTPLRDVDAALQLGAEAGSVHRVEKLAFEWDRLHGSGSAQIATEAPLQLEAHVDLNQDETPERPAWNASGAAIGPLAAPLVQATVRAAGNGGRPEQSLDARATVRPFAPWPLGDLQLTVRSLDLSAIHAALPVTALTGSATAATHGLDEPAALAADLQNADAGAWNAGRLPLRSLVVDLRARPNALRALDLPSFAAELGSRSKAAGRVEGRGRLEGEQLTLDLALSDVQPALLDARAPSMRLSGPLAIKTSPPDAAGNAGPIDVKGSLQGRLADRGPARAAQLRLDASLAATRIEIREAIAKAGGAVASVAGSAVRADAAAPWKVDAKVALQDFDPVPWWPAADDAAWQRARHRLNAKAAVDLAVPMSVASMPLFEALAVVRGAASVAIANSVVAGVPLQGDIAWRNGDGKTASATVALVAAGNTAKVEGRLGFDRAGADDAWRAVVEAPALARLAPLWRLALAASGGASGASTPASATASNRSSPGAARAASPSGSIGMAGIDLAAPSGSLHLNGTATGRWPALTTRGELDAAALRIGPASATTAQARWNVGSTEQSPLEIDAQVGPASFRDIALESLRWRLSGTARAHETDLRAESAVLPPDWTATVAALTPAARVAASAASAPASASASASRSTTSASTPTAASAPGAAAAVRPSERAPPGARRSVALLQASGGFVGALSSGFAGWRGSVAQAELRSSVDGTPAWLVARDLRLDTRWADGPARVALDPGRVEVLGAELRWSRFAWQAASGAGVPMRLDVQADLAPLGIAPLLRRLQPDFGWGGDLTVGGRIDVRTTPGVSADVVLERKGGDLTVTDEIGTQALGLTDLRLGLVAADGVWSFSQALAGSTVGVAAGAVVARTAPGATWPTAQTPIQGVVELQVANLGTWGTWVPAGWRLDGELRTSASIAGRFGAPEYTGRVVGRGVGMRNFLQGVAVTDGDVDIALQGTSARIERFTARAGNGSATLEGTAALGEAPKANLKLTASRFQVLGRIDRRIVASGAAQLRLDRDTAALDGGFTVDEGLIDFSRSDAPSLSDDVEVVRRKPAASSVPRAGAPPSTGASRASTSSGSSDAPGSSANGTATSASAGTSDSGGGAASTGASPLSIRHVALDLKVGMGEYLRVKGHGLDSGLRGELRVTSPNNRLAINGVVYAADGTYAAYGQKLAIDRGQLAFSGGVENPRLDIEATRPDLDVRVGVAVTGTALNPRIRLFSEPAMSEMDKLSWLVLGRASEGLGNADTALLQRAALALLAGEGGGGSDQLTKAIGLDSIGVRQQSDGDVRDTIVSLGKQISRRWYVGYERGLNATAGSWQLVYRIAQRFTLRAQSGADSSMDLIWTWRWQ